MDHGHHGDMDMPDGDPMMCNMNVNHTSKPILSRPLYRSDNKMPNRCSSPGPQKTSA